MSCKENIDNLFVFGWDEGIEESVDERFLQIFSGKQSKPSKSILKSVYLPQYQCNLKEQDQIRSKDIYLKS